VPDDHAEVCWLRADGTRVVPEPNARLRVIDRAFIHGDVVARAANALGTQGSVIAVNVDVDLQFADGTRAHGVSTRRLTQVRHYRPGHYVVHPGLGGWVGRIEEVSLFYLRMVN
jgi:ubiquitin-conjugating enzyme E2 O